MPRKAGAATLSTTGIGGYGSPRSRGRRVEGAENRAACYEVEQREQRVPERERRRRPQPFHRTALVWSNPDEVWGRTSH